MPSSIHTSYYQGNNCSGISGATGRTLTIDNTALTSTAGFIVAVDRSFFALNTDYTVSHSTTSTIITFVNAVWDEQAIVVNYVQFSSGLVAADDLVSGNAVTYSSLVSKVRDNIVALITSSNVPDPIATSSEYRKWIYSRIPDVKATDFKGYPFIVVHPAEFEVEEGGSMNGKSKFVSWQIEIEIFASDRGYGSADGQGLIHLDEISDDLLQTLLDMTIRNALSGNNLKFSNPRVTSVVTEVVGDELVYRRSIIENFKNRIQVSA